MDIAAGAGEGRDDMTTECTPYKYVFYHSSEDYGCEPGTTYYVAYLIPPMFSTNLKHLKKLAVIMQEAFPTLSEDAIEFSIVTKSRWCDKFPVARATIFDFDKTKIPAGWLLRSHTAMDFSIA